MRRGARTGQCVDQDADHGIFDLPSGQPPALRAIGFGLGDPRSGDVGSATSGQLGRVTVLPQLKGDRLCSVVDGTADFDPFETPAARGCLESETTIWMLFSLAS